MWHGDEGMGWWMLFGGIWMLVFWGAIIAFVVWGVKKLTDRAGSGSSTASKRDPMETARERYARGEISKEEFEEIRRTLS